MVRKLGKAMAEAIGQGEKEITAVSGKSLLMNPLRSSIFQFITRNPCSNLTNIVRSLGINASTGKWHVRILINEGYITSTDIGSSTIYYPMNMLEQEDIALLHSLNRPHVKALFEFVVGHPGLNQGELAKEIAMSKNSVHGNLQRLLDLCLISEIRDGRYKRYFPTSLVKEKQDLYYERAKFYTDELLIKLKRDRLSPKLDVSSGGEIRLHIKSGSDSQTLNIAVNPFVGLFKSKK
jgi:DNA-binding MarR family transcriptional regulator